jgi:Tfp pilus assembly protein PilF
MHRAFLSYVTNSQEALDMTTEALKIDPTNVLVLLFRSTLNFWIGNTDSAFTDNRTAARLSPEGWTAPTYLQMLYDFTLKNYLKAIDEVSRIIDAQPEQWYPYYIRAMQHFMVGDYSHSRDDLNKALTLNPTANFPYLLLIYLELRDGNISSAKMLYDDSLHKFPDFTFGSRLIEVMSGVHKLTEFKGTFDVFSNLLFERYAEAKMAATAMLDEGIVKPEFYIGRAFAECSLDEFKEAVSDLDLAEQLDDQNVLLYLLRAQSRLQLKDIVGATEDIRKAQSLSTDPNFPFAVQSALSGKLSCKNYFDFVVPTAESLPA